MIRIKNISLPVALVFFSLISSVHAESFKWPNGAKAAFALTYDDALTSHLNTAVPMLDKYDFKATFYLTMSSPLISKEFQAWKAIAKKGHELANHTLFHPCQKSKPGMQWVAEHRDLDNYSLARVIDEIALANRFLTIVDGQSERTFAYPCAHVEAGGKSYVPFLKNHVIAARTVSNKPFDLPSANNLDLYQLPSFAINNTPVSELLRYIDTVIEQETFGSFTFHGVGAEYLSILKNDHETILRHLKKHNDVVWVAPVSEIAKYIAGQQASN